MGKGDKKTKKGKISIGSFGVSRPKRIANRPKATKKAKPKQKPAIEKPKPKAKKKPEA